PFEELIATGRSALEPAVVDADELARMVRVALEQVRMRRGAPHDHVVAVVAQRQQARTELAYRNHVEACADIWAASVHHRDARHASVSEAWCSGKSAAG